MLDEYSARIGLTGRPSLDLAGFDALQRAHTQSIGFENLDVMLGRPIKIDSESAFDKIVRRGRGGYCFEQNRVFRDVLAALGVTARPLLARVYLNLAPGEIPARSHVCLTLDIEGAPHLLDAGFGGLYIAPIPLVDGAISASGHRLRRFGEPGSVGGEWLLERAAPQQGGDVEWQPQYSFSMAEVAQPDLEQASHWTSTRAGERFTTEHIASISLPNGFAALSNKQLTLYSARGKETRTLDDPLTYAATLRGMFRINLSDDEVQRLPLFREG